jgi:hypothetical protein
MNHIRGDTSQQHIEKCVVQNLVGGVDPTGTTQGIKGVNGALTSVETADGVSHHHIVRVARTYRLGPEVHHTGGGALPSTLYDTILKGVLLG